MSKMAEVNNLHAKTDLLKSSSFPPRKSRCDEAGESRHFFADRENVKMVCQPSSLLVFSESASIGRYREIVCCLFASSLFIRSKSFQATIITYSTTSRTKPAQFVRRQHTAILKPSCHHRMYSARPLDEKANIFH